MMISFPGLGQTIISAPCNYFSTLAGHPATVSHHILMNIKEKRTEAGSGSLTLLLSLLWFPLFVFFYKKAYAMTS